MKLILKEQAAKLIAAYTHSADTGEGGKEVLVKFFTPWANATWYITEGMPVDENGEPVDEIVRAHIVDRGTDPELFDWHLFGFCDLGDRDCAELGFVMLSELKSLKGPAGLRVERDRHFSKPLADVMRQYGRAA